MAPIAMKPQTMAEPGIIQIDDKIERNIIKKHSIFTQFLSYGLIGVFCASLDGFAFWLLRKNMLNLYLANVISVNMGIITSFFLNRHFTFNVKNFLFKRALKFFTVNYCGLLISMGILHIGVYLMNQNDMFVKIISIFFVATFQFTLNKFVTFKIG
jgi:putative flippase GtrA